MIIKISPDSEKARSIFSMAKLREQQLKELDITKFSTIIAENYYEVIKEMATAILLIKGIKATGEYAHKDLIEQALKYNLVDDFEHSLLDDLRNKRNKSQYEGKQIEVSYLENNQNAFDKIIIKLKKILEEELR